MESTEIKAVETLNIAEGAFNIRSFRVIRNDGKIHRFIDNDFRSSPQVQEINE